MPTGYRPSRILPLHLAAALLISLGGAMAMHILPLIARLRFDANSWQSLLVTASLPTFMVASIFWNEWFARVSIRRYMILHWISASLPLALIAVAQNYWQMLAFHVLAAIGAAGFTPAWGALLKLFYRDQIRGRAFGLLTIATLLGGVAVVYVAGRWLQADPDAFRIFLPLMAGLQAIGIVLILRLVAWTRAESFRQRGRRRPLKAVLRPVFHMGRTLWADRRFLRYEAAFMTYGIGFHICEAVFPLLVTDGLGMEYKAVTESAHVVTRVCTLLCVFPAGWLMDRVGAARTSALSFALLALYPVGLALARDEAGLALASVIYGVAMGGVFQGWWLGPVSLAPTRSAVASYVAIHTALVGIRGTLAQGLGVGLYALTGSFAAALAIAAGMLVWSAVQMWQLHRFSLRHSPLVPVGVGQT